MRGRPCGRAAIPNLSGIADETFFRAIGPTRGDVEARSIQDGHQRWHIPSGNTFIDLIAESGTLYLETQQGEVDARRTPDGNLLWQYQGASGDLSLSLANHVLYLVGKDFREVVVLDPIKGTCLWQLALGNSISAFIVS